MLKHDAGKLIYPTSAYISYHLMKMAIKIPQFAEYSQEMKFALEAHNSKEHDEWKKKTDPWYSDEVGGARLFANIVKKSKLNILVILKNLLWNLDEDSDYINSEEIPMLGTAMSLTFDIWDKTELSRIEKYKILFDYIIDESDGNRKYIKMK